jgi:hypothetical protein
MSNDEPPKTPNRPNLSGPPKRTPIKIKSGSTHGNHNVDIMKAEEVFERANQEMGERYIPVSPDRFLGMLRPGVQSIPAMPKVEFELFKKAAAKTPETAMYKPFVRGLVVSFY